MTNLKPSGLLYYLLHGLVLETWLEWPGNEEQTHSSHSCTKSLRPGGLCSPRWSSTSMQLRNSVSIWTAGGRGQVFLVGSLCMWAVLGCDQRGEEVSVNASLQSCQYLYLGQRKSLPIPWAQPGEGFVTCIDLTLALPLFLFCLHLLSMRGE